MQGGLQTHCGHVMSVSTRGRATSDPNDCSKTTIGTTTARRRDGGESSAAPECDVVRSGPSRTRSGPLPASTNGLDAVVDPASDSRPPCRRARAREGPAAYNYAEPPRGTPPHPMAPETAPRPDAHHGDAPTATPQIGEFNTSRSAEAATRSATHRPPSCRGKTKRPLAWKTARQERVSTGSRLSECSVAASGHPLHPPCVPRDTRAVRSCI